MSIPSQKLPGVSQAVCKAPDFEGRYLFLSWKVPTCRNRANRVACERVVRRILRQAQGRSRDHRECWEHAKKAPQSPEASKGAAGRLKIPRLRSSVHVSLAEGPYNKKWGHKVGWAA